MLKIALERLPELYAALSNEKQLYIPMEKNDAVQYGVWQEGAEVRLDVLNTVKSAKDLFFPQSENLVAFKLSGKNISVIENRDDSLPFVIFGVRACDAASFEILDKVFLADPVDTYYQSRRENGTVVTMACNEPEETCFCNVFDIDSQNPKGDVETWLSGDVLYWNSVTEKGEKLTETVKSLFEDVSAEDKKKLDSHKETVNEIMEKLPFHDLSLEGFNGDELLEKFNSPKWKELSESCIGCGTCTFICPTCQCYDIRDYDTGHGIQRYRCWDSCMYSDFTKMAHGNPRTSQLERFRQRFMHKLIYFPANNDGMYSCVGCGRCLAKCPISMNIVKVIKALGVNANE